MSRFDGNDIPRYAFVHGNLALGNSCGGRFCGVNEEMQILQETSCYLDTLHGTKTLLKDI